MMLESLESRIDMIYINWEREYKRQLNKKQIEAAGPSVPTASMAKALSTK